MSAVRNNLSHYPTNAQLSMDDITMQKYFQDMSDFVQCLVDLQHVTQQKADDIKDELDQVNHTSDPVKWGRALIFDMLGESRLKP